jgi:hypothetical protein
MSGGANKTFLNDPAVFLRDNVILLREGGMPYASGRYRVNLHAVTDDLVTSETDTQLGVFVPFLAQANPHHTQDRNVEEADANPTFGRMVLPGKSSSRHSHQFYAWYIPWGPNRSFTQQLDNTAKVLFTPGLTGCTFAAVGPNNPRVGHFNYLKEGTDKVSKKRTRAEVAKEFGGSTGAQIEKPDYLTPEGVIQRYVYIVGWKGAAGWRFVAQTLDHVGAGKTGRILRRVRAPEQLQFVHTF